MLLTDITKIIRVLLAAYQPLASQDQLTQRRIGQIGEVIGAVEDVAEDEEQDSPIAEKRVEEAHDIIHRIAAILAMEEGRDEGGGDEEGAGNETENDEAGNAGVGGADYNDDALREEIWNGKLDGETIELKEDDEE